jgi:hypothetical protein
LQFADCSPKKFADLRLQFNKKKFEDLKFLDSHILKFADLKNICTPHLCKFATVVNHTGSKFAASVNDTGVILPLISTTPAVNLPPVSTAPVVHLEL